jgi:hypothetical protein
MRNRKYAAHIHKRPRVSHPIIEAFTAKALVGFGPAEGTISLVLLTAECINMVRKRLPLVCS